MGVTFGESIPKTQQSATPVLPMLTKRTRPRFTMMIHKDQWEWDPRLGEWLPRISNYGHDPGVQGVGFDPRTKRVDTSAADQHYRGKGYICFENGDPRLHIPDLPSGEFMVRLRAGNGYAYLWVWEGFEKVGKAIDWEVNWKVKNSIQKHLITSKVIPPMHPKLKQQHIKKLANRVRRLGEAISENTSPSLRVRLTAAETLLALWEADLKKSKKGTR